MPKIRCIHCETSFVSVQAAKKHETTCPLKQLSWLFSDTEQFTKEVEKRKEIFQKEDSENKKKSKKKYRKKQSKEEKTVDSEQKEKSKRENEKRPRKEYMRKYMRKYRESKEEKTVALELLQLKHVEKKAPKEKRIGAYTIPERKAVLERYHAKRKRRVFAKKRKRSENDYEYTISFPTVPLGFTVHDDTCHFGHIYVEKVTRVRKEMKKIVVGDRLMKINGKDVTSIENLKLQLRQSLLPIQVTFRKVAKRKKTTAGILGKRSTDRKWTEFQSVTEAGSVLSKQEGKVFSLGNIVNVCRGRSKHHHGYQFKYKK